MQPGKKERRLYYRELQAAFPLQQFASWNRQLASKLQAVLTRLPKDSFMAVYQARAREADLRALFSEPYRFCFPKILSRDGAMEFRWVKNPLDANAFTPGPWGIMEPTGDALLVEKSQMAAGFVPLLAFDDAGGRLGQGKGFYDRFLDHFPGLKIGVAFEWQFSPMPLPVEAHDHALDIVVSEAKIRECGG